MHYRFLISLWMKPPCCWHTVMTVTVPFNEITGMGRHYLRCVLQTHFFCNTCTGPQGFQVVEAAIFQDNWHMKVNRFSALCTGCLYPQGDIPGTHFFYRLSWLQVQSVTGRMSTKNSNDTVENRTRDLPACSSVPQPTVPHPSPHKYTLLNLHLPALSMVWTFVTHTSYPQYLDYTTANTEHITNHWKNAHELNCSCLLSNTVQLQPPYIVYIHIYRMGVPLSLPPAMAIIYLVNKHTYWIFWHMQHKLLLYLHKMLCISQCYLFLVYKIFTFYIKNVLKFKCLNLSLKVNQYWNTQHSCLLQPIPASQGQVCSMELALHFNKN